MNNNSITPHVSKEFPGPKGKAVLDLFNKYKSPSLSVHPPLVWARADGAVVEDVDGNRFIDLSSGIAVANIGHSHPTVTAAIKSQAERLLNCYDHPTAVRAQVQKEIAEITPTDLGSDSHNRVHMVSAGSEAIEFAIKLCRRSTSRYELITTHGGFHGRGSIQTMALTDDIKYRRGYGIMPPGILHVPYAYCYRCPYEEKYPDCDLLCAKQFKRVLQFESVGDVAAFFVEPIQGAAGYIVPPDDYLIFIKGFCNQNGILMVADEIQSGFGRTGKLFAIEHANVKPDVMALGKSLGGGIPIGAVSARESIVNSMSPGDHSTTFGGNPLSCAAALTNMQILRDSDEILTNVREVGQYAIQELTQMMERHKIIGDVRGRGLMIGVELVKDRQSKTPATEEMKIIREELYHSGVIMVTAGLYGSVLRIAPPLNITKDHMDKGLAILESVLTEVEQKMS